MTGELQCTPVFEWNWDAAHLMCYVVTPVESNVYEAYKYDTDDDIWVYHSHITVDSSKYRLDKMKVGRRYYLCDTEGLREYPELLSRRYKYLINEGSSRSSKTYSLIDVYDMYARENENKRMTVWRDTKVDCKATVLNDILKRHKSTGRYKVGYTFNKTDSSMTYDTGSINEILGTDDEEKVHGLTQSVAWLNEPYKIGVQTFNQIDQRTEDFVIIDWNPKKTHWIDDLKQDDRAILIKSTFRDNKFCPPESRRKFLSYQPLRESSVVLSGKLSARDAEQYDVEDNPMAFTEKEIEELCRCIDNENKGSASMYNWCVYGKGEKAERPNRIFNFNKCKDSVYFNLDVKEYFIVDWGAVDPWAILGMKYYDGCLYFHEYNYDSENQIKAKMDHPTIRKINDDDDGIVPWMFNRLNIPHDAIIICDNNRPKKIRALRQAGWEYAVAAIKGEILDGIDLLNSITVYYTDSSANFEMEQELYSRCEDRYGVVMEKAEDLNNHLMDCSRYGAEFLQREGIIRKI